MTPSRGQGHTWQLGGASTPHTVRMEAASLGPRSIRFRNLALIKNLGTKFMFVPCCVLYLRATLISAEWWLK